MFAGTIKKRSDGLCSKSTWAVRDPTVPETRWTITCSRGHERFANSPPTISGVVEKTTAWRNPSRCKMRSRRSSRSEEHTSELQSHSDLVCRLLLEKKKTGP